MVQRVARRAVQNGAAEKSEYMVYSACVLASRMDHMGRTKSRRLTPGLGSQQIRARMSERCQDSKDILSFHRAMDAGGVLKGECGPLQKWSDSPLNPGTPPF